MLYIMQVGNTFRVYKDMVCVRIFNDYKTAWCFVNNISLGDISLAPSAPIERSNRDLVSPNDIPLFDNTMSFNNSDLFNRNTIVPQPQQQFQQHYQPQLQKFQPQPQQFQPQPQLFFESFSNQGSGVAMTPFDPNKAFNFGSSAAPFGGSSMGGNPGYGVIGDIPDESSRLQKTVQEFSKPSGNVKMDKQNWDDVKDLDTVEIDGKYFVTQSEIKRFIKRLP